MAVMSMRQVVSAVNIETKFHIIKGDGFSDYIDTDNIVIK